MRLPELVLYYQNRKTHTLSQGSVTLFSSSLPPLKVTITFQQQDLILRHYFPFSFHAGKNKWEVTFQLEQLSWPHCTQACGKSLLWKCTACTLAACVSSCVSSSQLPSLHTAWWLAGVKPKADYFLYVHKENPYPFFPDFFFLLYVFFWVFLSLES